MLTSFSTEAKQPGQKSCGRSNSDHFKVKINIAALNKKGEMSSRIRFVMFVSRVGKRCKQFG